MMGQMLCDRHGMIRMAHARSLEVFEVKERGMGRFLLLAVIPVLAYYGVTWVVVFLAASMHWGNNTLNIVNQAANIIVLYLVFYRKYDEFLGKGRLPALLPSGRDAETGARKIPMYHYIWIVLLGCGTSLLLNNLIVLTQLNQHITTYNEVAKNIYSGGLFLVFLRTVVLAACMEELLMRGLFYRSISCGVGRLLGMLISALVFGVIHGNLLQGIYAFLLGIVFCYVYDRYNRNLFASILAHMAANLVSVMGSMVPRVGYFIALHFIRLTVIAAVVCLVAAIAMWKLLPSVNAKQASDSAGPF